MKIPSFSTNTATAAGLLLAVYFVGFPFGTSVAGSLRPLTYQQLTAIHEHIDGQAYDEALSALHPLLDEVSDYAYEKAVILQTLAYAQIGREDYAAAIVAFEQSIALDQLPGDIQQRMRYDLAQLCLSTGRTTRAIELLEHWFSQVKQADTGAYALLGQAYAQNRQYLKAIDNLQHAINLSEKAHADWYEALLAMHYEIKSYRACIPLLKDMIRLFPQRRRYWQQLAGIHLTMDNPEAAIGTLELALRDGALTREQDLTQLAQLYLHAGIPYKAAGLLDREVRSGRVNDNALHRKMLAQAWTAAGERTQAVHALEKAIEAAPDPQLRLQLAQWYFDEKRWQDAENILLTVVDRRENMKIQVQSLLLLGIARYEQGKTVAAHETFMEASRLPGGRDIIRPWLKFLEALAEDRV